MASRAIIVLCLLAALPAFGDGTLVQQCDAANSAFSPTTSASCTLTGVGAHHSLIIWGFSCRSSCGLGTQATHSMSDTLALSYGSSILYQTINATTRGGIDRAFSIWCADTGTSTGNDTITLTLNTSSGNAIEAQEWSGTAAACAQTGSGGPSFTQGFHPSGGTPPIIFTGGTITIGGAANTVTVEGTLAADSDYWVAGIAFQVTSGHPLLYVYGSCNNCGGAFQNTPPGYTKNSNGIGNDGNGIFMSANAAVGNGVPRRKGWVF
jgi:hypothetical protein